MDEILDRLPVGAFQDVAAHLVLGDLNVVLNASLDSASRARNPRSEGRSACLDWLTHLGVADVWRLHHPDERVSLGPQPRINRLDQIFLSDDINQHMHRSSKHSKAANSGDHLVHEVRTDNSYHRRGSSYWMLPRHLSEYPAITNAIQEEARALGAAIHTAENPGLVPI